ncbi:SDR family oxidoreductase [Myxococcota bacterium]|nr:SDR family oxidoreductase [Myxococcota bacterium]
MRFSGRRVMVTGAGSGMGEATAKRFAEEGASVSLVDVDKAGLERVTAEISEGGGVAASIHADIASTDGAEGAIRASVDRFGGLDVLVNNAGVSTMADPSWKASEEEWDRVLSVNLKGVFLCSKYAIPEIKKAGGGAIVNTASIAAEVSCAGAAYTASKGGVAMLTRTLAVELAQEGVRVNAVGPGFMITPMSTGERQGANEEQIQARLDGFASRVPMGRCGLAVEVANAILFLASDEASYITGQHLCVDGGFTAV